MEYALRLRTTKSGELNIILFLDKSLSFNPSSVAHTTCDGWMNEQFLIEYKKWVHVTFFAYYRLRLGEYLVSMKVEMFFAVE